LKGYLHLLEQILMKLNFIHIKSHQDDDKELTTLMGLNNCHADRLCDRISRPLRRSIITTLHPASNASLTINGANNPDDSLTAF
jgi:hypothetical protein